MVSTKSSKTAKFSYVERVLGALSQVQKDHRKHAIHLATLRAQIKKTAQSKKDKLGPQWSNWVAKAVHKLEEDGILTSEAAGNVTLTPYGKKTIAAARRSLLVSSNAIPTPADEDQIWKHVTNQSQSRGTKRGRTSHVGLSTTGEDLDMEASVSSFQPYSTRSKKARTSLGGSTARSIKSLTKKPVSKMTKAELKIALNLLQREHAEALWRATSPLTDLGDEDAEETARLKEELKQRQGEIESIRRELAEARVKAGSQSQRSSSRFATPDTTFDFATSSPTWPRPADAAAQSKAFLGLTRTHSGSIISELSKQPTPTPSSPGDAGDLGHGADNESDVFGPSPQDDDTRNVPRARPGTNTLATPTATPRRPSHFKDRGAEFAKEVQQYKAFASDVELREKDAPHKVVVLERNLSSREGELRDFEAKLSQLRTDCSKATREVSQRDSRITILRTEIEGLVEKISDNALVIALKNVELGELRSTKKILETSLEEHGQSLRERDASIVALNTEKEASDAQFSDLQQALSRAEKAIAEHVAQTSAAETQAVSLNSAIEAARADLQAQRSANAALFDRQTALGTELQTQKDLSATSNVQSQVHMDKIAELALSIDALQLGKKTVARELAQVTAEKAILSKKLQDVETSNESLLEQLTAAMDEKSAAEVALVTSQATVNALTLQLVALDEALVERNDAVTELRGSLLSTQENADALHNRVVALEATVASLGADLEISAQTVEELQGQLTTSVGERADLSAQLETTQTAIVESAASIAQSELTINSMAQDLLSGTAFATDLQTTLNTVATQLKAEEGRACRLTDDLTMKEQELQGVREKLTMTESMAGKFRLEVEESEKKIQELRLEVLDVREDARAAEKALAEAKAQSASERSGHELMISSLNGSLTSAQNEVTGLVTQLESVHLVQNQIESKLEERTAELSSAKATFDAERSRAVALEEDLVVAVSKVQDAREELVDFKISKEADEATIESFKHAFAKLRDAQMQALTELDNKASIPLADLTLEGTANPCP